MTTRLAAGFVVVATAGIFGQTLPRTSVLVDRVAAYVQTYQREFVEIVADERTVQEVIVGGQRRDRRETRGELFATFVEADDTWMSVHDVLEVDGTALPRTESVRELLATTPFGLAARRLAEANARFNIGPVTRNFNEPTLALLAFTRRYSSSIAFDRERVRQTDGSPPLARVTFRGRDGASIVRSGNRQVAMHGSALVEIDTGRVRSTIVVFDDRQVAATLETRYELDANVGVLVPTRFTESYVRRDGQQTLVTTTLTNFRRFGVQIRIVQ